MKIWIFQSGEPLHTDADNLRPMRAMNLANVLLDMGHEVVLWSSSFFHQEKRHRSEGYEVLKPRDRLEIRLIPSPGYQKNIGVGRIYDHVKLAQNLLTALKKAISLPGCSICWISTDRDGGCVGSMVGQARCTLHCRCKRSMALNFRRKVSFILGLCLSWLCFPIFILAGVP